MFKTKEVCSALCNFFYSFNLNIQPGIEENFGDFDSFNLSKSSFWLSSITEKSQARLVLIEIYQI